MALQLPAAFEGRMKSLLQDQYSSFIAAYDRAPYGGIRVNTLKISVEDLLSLTEMDLTPIPWCPTGFYTASGERPGKHAHYHTGLYYIQEPSAMAPVEQLDVKPGHAVLDLCAAPGGKSTQIAAKLQGEGMLISNDLNTDRTKALAKNIELYGVRNAIVLNETPDRIASQFPFFFDRILIDAPCSGEGMFRKDEDMVRQWTEESPDKYAGMQRDILKAAARMLKPGGRIVYSTCTFSPEENEGMMAEFLSAHPHFHVVPIGGTGSFAKGETGWLRKQEKQVVGISESIWQEVEDTGRLWPHLVDGEGHFIAVLQHDGQEGEHSEEQSESFLRSSVSPDRSKQKEAPKRERDRLTGSGGKRKSSAQRQNQHAGEKGRNPQDAIESYKVFVKEHLSFVPGGYTVSFGNHIYQSPLPEGRLDGLKVIRPGWYMGQAKNGRFIPGHPLAAALKPEEFSRVINLFSKDGDAVRYLKGETLEFKPEQMKCSEGTAPKGYALVCIDGYSAGWGKWQDGLLKNEYPPGWRWTSA